MRSLLSRKSSLLGIFLAVSLTLPALAQYRGASAKKKTNPRAVAVLQVLPTGKARLLPVSIFLNGQYYDARYYMAKPVPLALYDQTVYEALTDGLPTGEFTVHNARIQPNMIWGEGDWKLLGSPTKSDASGKPAPILDKGPVSTVTFPGTVKETKEERRQDKRDEKAHGKNKPEARPPSTTPPPSNPPKDDNDPDRPTLKKTDAGPQVTLKPSDITPRMPADNDSDRPTLSRANKGEQEKPETMTAPQSGIAGAKYIVAVSDPDPMENRPYQYNWTEAEKAKYTQQLTKLATDAVKKFVGPNKPPLPADLKFQDVQVRALDLDYSNSPYLVFTGQVPPVIPPPSAKMTTSAPEQAAIIYATLVVRVSSTGELSRLLTKVTDSRHLDAASRYDLVDAVDADGDNRAELLFRRTNDAGSTYVLYRVTPFELTQVFEGGAAL